MAGDLNEVAGPSEKSGGAPVRSSRCSKFVDCVNDCKLLDLGRAILYLDGDGGGIYSRTVRQGNV